MPRVEPPSDATFEEFEKEETAPADEKALFESASAAEPEDEENDDDEDESKPKKAFFKSTPAKVGGIVLAVAAAAGGVIAASQKGCAYPYTWDLSFIEERPSQSFCISQRAVPVADGAEGETELEYRTVGTKWEKRVPVGSKKEKRGDDTVYTTPDGTELVFRAAAVDWDDTAAQVDSTGAACAKRQVQKLVKK